MSDRSIRRAELLNRLNDALYEDARLAGAVLVGSGAHGFRDDYSDIDVVAPVASEYDAAAVFRQWKERIGDVVAVLYRAETAFTEQNHLMVLLCDDLLEVDLSFPSVESLVASAPHWQILWDRSGEVARRMALSEIANGITAEQAYVWTLNRAVHRAVYAAKALRRGQVWKAMLLLDELRCRGLQLAYLDALGEACSDVFGENGIERHVDALPPEVLAQFSCSLPAVPEAEAVRESLAACVDATLGYAIALDQRYGLSLSEALGSVLGEHLNLLA